MSIFARNKATAKIVDGRLVLSMPDAETPAVWVMDLSETLTTVLRVELDKQGLYVLKKHGGKTAAETVGVYRYRYRALQALKAFSKTLDKARAGKSAYGDDRLTRRLVIILFIWFALFRIGQLDTLLLQIALSPIFGMTQSAATSADYEAQIEEIMRNMSPEELGRAPAQQQPDATPDRAGVPLSADDFLRYKAENPDTDGLY